MQKLLLLCVAVLLLGSCAKDHTVNPVNSKPSFKLSFAPVVNGIPNTPWKQVLGGKGLITFAFIANDTVTASTIKDSVSLKDISTYKHDVLAGAYNITLGTVSAAVADTFIRFNAQAQNITINKDQAISLPATTTDGVITISKSLIKAGTTPTFTDAKTAVVYKLGLANDYYFLYAKDATAGRLSFTETTSGDVFLKDLTLAALNWYDVSAVLNKTSSVSIAQHAFNLNGFSGKVQ
ncbi:hypothetical protein [Mucilaginibacter jinjuensis]|uniref:DUF4397 domain-containing protein n=1 Tax=Mucilaginibacter jinjuensis TaxID=1176721 RepID=A0ABY7T6W2_9SPHI|nr:hypothetical protein [Mucilaginibacter jinjuensis]WCT10972.1 hypothetical protein PQO05_19735 [Mucilaginibacter jinjuensis]